MDRGAAEVLGQKVEEVGREWVIQMTGSRWIGGLAPAPLPRPEKRTRRKDGGSKVKKW